MINNPTRGSWSVFSGQLRSLNTSDFGENWNLDVLKKKGAQSLSFNNWVPVEVFKGVVLSSSPHSRVSICKLTDPRLNPNG